MTQPSRIHRFLLTAFVLLTFIQCKHEPVPGPEQPPQPDPDTIISTECDPDTVYFINDVLPVFLSSCAKSGCHDEATQADGVYLATYSAIISTGKIKPGNPDDSEVYEVITENDPDKIMPPPPNAPLTAAQIDLIRKWISQGALNNYCASTDCDSVNVTFSGTIWPMINASCKGCHNIAAPGGGVLLQNYTEVKNQAFPRIWSAINHLEGYSPMPKNSPKWSKCKIAQFKRWIDLGMPDN
ncbi:MAG TPA: hypothetical protein P5531_05190 [Bacteroidales bacterium]|nr:hypothetical protein [Bacteroidales bacterium]HSA42601.1 hypothetical protein [Bacteroidales bacterium]